MNCLAQSVAKAISQPPAAIYTGVGHGEPIHMSEICAWLLTQGYAACPVRYLISTLPLTGIIEGETTTGEPHAVAVGDLIEKINIVWYFVPVPINPTYVKEFTRRRDEAVCLGMFPRRVD